MLNGLKKWVVSVVALCVLVPTMGQASGLKISLQSDEGTYFGRCSGCQKTVGNKFNETITTQGNTQNEPFAQFELVLVGNDKVALKSDIGNFVARCNSCVVGGTEPDFAMLHVPDSKQPIAQFTIETLSNGKYALKGDIGKYLARCNSCSPGASQPNTAVVSGTDPNKQPHAQWTIRPIFPKGTKISLQGDDGTYFSRCSGCQTTVGNKVPDTIITHKNAPTTPYDQFEVEDVGGGKIALKADNGKYLDRCNSCIVGGTQPDFLTVQAANSAQPTAQFKLVLLNNGKWGMQSDTGKYLARCNGCSPGATQPNTVTMSATDPNKETAAQWNIAYAP